MEIQFTTRVFKEGRAYVAHALELDVSSCGGSAERAIKNLKEAVRLFLEECEKMGTLDRVLQEAGYSRSGQKLRGPKLVSMQQISLPLPLTHAKA
jgi:predicted RNase H-like HicB family nuclease